MTVKHLVLIKMIPENDSETFDDDEKGVHLVTVYCSVQQCVAVINDTAKQQMTHFDRLQNTWQKSYWYDNTEVSFSVNDTKSDTYFGYR